MPTPMVGAGSAASTPIADAAVAFHEITAAASAGSQPAALGVDPAAGDESVTSPPAIRVRHAARIRPAGGLPDAGTALGCLMATSRVGGTPRRPGGGAEVAGQTGQPVRTGGMFWLSRNRLSGS